MSSAELDSLSGDTTSLGGRAARVMATGIVRQRAMFAVAVVTSLLYGVTSIADAWILGWATNHLIYPSFAAGEVLNGTLWTVVALFIGTAVLRTIGVVGRRLAGGIVYYRLVRDDRMALTRAYLRLPLSWHQAHPAGQLLSNANADVEARWFVFMPLPMALGVLAMLISAVVSMLLTDVTLTIVGLVAFPLLFAVNAVYQHAQGPRAARAQSLRGDLSAVAHESFDGALVVKSLGREAEETTRFEQMAHRLRDANIAVGTTRAMFDPIVDALPQMAVLAVIWLGALRVMAGDATPGAVVQVAFLFTIIGFPVRAFGWVMGEIPRCVVGNDRVRAVLDRPERTVFGGVALAGRAPIALGVENLSFCHGDKEVLVNLSFAVPAGTVTALVGATGSGKSTLLELIGRLIEPASGTIDFDGVPVDRLSHDAFTASCALVAQSSFLFDDTVRENVTLGAEIDDAELWAVLRMVRAESFVGELADGLDTRIGERGTSLSGGQRQRLSLARALVKRPRLLLLDDATSAIDPQVEAEILAELETSDTTVLVAAHRRATIALADGVIHLDGGRIVASGTDAELRRTSPAYRDLVDAYEQERGPHE